MAPRPSSLHAEKATTELLHSTPRESCNTTPERSQRLTDRLTVTARTDDATHPSSRVSRISRASQRLSTMAQKLHITKAARICVRDVAKNVDIILGEEPLTLLEVKLRLMGPEHYPGKFLPNIILLNARTRYEFEDDSEVIDPSPETCAVLLFSKTKSSDIWEQVFFEHAQIDDADGVKRAIDVINRDVMGSKAERTGEEIAGAAVLSLLRNLEGTGLDEDVEWPVRVLRQAGASMDVCDEHGWTALHFACNHGHAGLVQMLLGAPTCEVNAVDERQFTPLHYACLSQCTEAVKTLVENKANVNACTADGKTALEFAKSGGQTDIVNILMKAHKEIA
eukprot:GEMP01022517.1.p1 GENE.GEMP01022517.1~~GEMP01022517.1.p1  ORF type:complete len:337 (+),score=80.86 GEMP01022517.1:215-1225(+)